MRIILFFSVIFLLGFACASNGLINYSSEDALNAINQSELILNEFISLDLPYASINDTIIEAKNVYLQAHYADILRGTINSSSEERARARDALRLVRWGEVDYSDVIDLTNKVDELRTQTLDLYDLINLEAKKVSEDISNNTLNYFLLARDSFYEGRLNESKSYLDRFISSYEVDSGSKSYFKTLSLEAKNFFYRYWLLIIIFVCILIFLAYFAYLKLRIYYLRRSVQKLSSEKTILSELLKKAQMERFKENKITALTYNVRVKSYQERLQKINSSLPVLQARLRKLLKI